MADEQPAEGDRHLATVVVNVQDMERAVGFWRMALGYRQREQDWDPEFMMLVDPEGKRLPISLQLTDSPPKDPVRGCILISTRMSKPRRCSHDAPRR